jgi:hypothetical protein
VAARGATGVAENKVGKNEEFSAPRKVAFLHHVLPPVSPQLHHVVPSKNMVEIAKPLVKTDIPPHRIFSTKTVESEHGNQQERGSGLLPER